MDQEHYRFYGSEGIDQFVENLTRNPEEELRYKALLELLPVDAVNILDVGAGHGILLSKIMSRGIECEGIEITQEKVNFASRAFGAKMVMGSSDSLPYPDDSFDYVYCCEVLEHLPYLVYEKTLKEISRVARKGIVVSVPYKEVRLRTKCPYCHTLFYPNYHFRTFSNRVLVCMFEGFRIESHGLAGTTFNLRFLPFAVQNMITRKYPVRGYCPACGYHHSEGKQKRISSSKAPDVRGLIRKLVPGTPRWHIVKYIKS